MIWTKAFWKGAGERALKTFIQVFVPTAMAALGATSTGTLDAWTAPWLVAAQTASGLALGATVISLLMSLGNAEFVSGQPGVVTAVLDGAEMPREIHTYYGAMPTATAEPIDVGPPSSDPAHPRYDGHGDYMYPPGESPSGK